MAKGTTARTASSTAHGPRVRGRRAGWVRKNVVMDQRKLDAARRVLGAESETETIDLALDFVAFRREVAEGLANMRKAGGVDDVLERRRP